AQDRSLRTRQPLAIPAEAQVRGKRGFELLSAALLRRPPFVAPWVLAVDFTVIVCTYNRAGNLPSCLGALTRQEGVEAIDWEVLVVDNNSSDDTPKTVERLSRELPIKVRYVRETQQGLNYARNCGVTSSRSTHFT